MSLTSYRAAPPREKTRRGKVPRELVCSNRGRGCEDRFVRNCHNVVSISPTACMVHKAEPSPDIATRALASLLRDIVASGRKPIETPDIADAIAVHELRKAFKRWRAILRLIEPTIGDEAELMRVEARDLAREVAIARDGQAVQESFAGLGADLPALSARFRAAVAERLAQISASAEAASLTPMRKARIGEMWTRGSAAIERWSIQRFDRMEATKQLAANYRRGPRATPPELWT